MSKVLKSIYKEDIRFGEGELLIIFTVWNSLPTLPSLRRLSLSVCDGMVVVVLVVLVFNLDPILLINNGKERRKKKKKKRRL